MPPTLGGTSGNFFHGRRSPNIQKIEVYLKELKKTHAAWCFLFGDYASDEISEELVPFYVGK